jgi:hypothetical protein
MPIVGARGFHRLQIKYLATRDGETTPLALPLPCTAFVPAGHVQVEEPQ